MGAIKETLERSNYCQPVHSVIENRKINSIIKYVLTPTEQIRSVLNKKKQ